MRAFWMPWGAIKAEVPDAFVLVSFAVLPDGYTREGMYCKDLARRMQESGIVDAVGLNCVSAPGAMRTLAKQLGGTLPLSVMPNAGYPVVTRTQVKYQGRPEYFARELGRLAAEGTVQDPGRLLRHYPCPHCRPAGGAGQPARGGKKRLRQKSFPP